MTLSQRTLTSSDIFRLHSLVRALASEKTNADGTAGVSGILDGIYGFKEDGLWSLRMMTGERVGDVYVVAKPSDPKNFSIAVHRAIMIGLGYNADNTNIPGTMFMPRGGDQPTDIDINTLRTLYAGQKKR